MVLPLVRERSRVQSSLAAPVFSLGFSRVIAGAAANSPNRSCRITSHKPTMNNPRLCGHGVGMDSASRSGVVRFEPDPLGDILE
jgi:hypothetical protein